MKLLENDTAWKVSRYGIFYGPYFPTFGPNTERYFVFLHITYECGKIRTRKNSEFGHISHSVIFSSFLDELYSIFKPS